MKKYVFSFLIVISIFSIAVVCKKSKFIESNYTLSNSFSILDTDNIDKTLSNQIYSEPNNIDEKYVAVITYKSNNATMKQYPINNNGMINLTIPKDSNFIISLHANPIIRYTWNIKNKLNNQVIQFENRSWIDTPMPKSAKDKIGASNDRQNFYFKPLKTAKEKVVMRYEHQTEQRDEFFEIIFNIKIE